MVDTYQERVEAKLDKCVNGLTELATRLETYPAVQEQVADHENRLTAIETLEVKKYEQRLKKLEAQLASFKGWIAGALAVGVVVAWALENIVGKL